MPYLLLLQIQVTIHLVSLPAEQTNARAESFVHPEYILSEILVRLANALEDNRIIRKFPNLNCHALPLTGDDTDGVKLV